MDKTRLKNMISKHYDIDFLSCESIENGISHSFIMHTKDLNYLVKIVPKAFEETIKDSLNVLLYLENYDFPGPKIKLTLSNRLYLEFEGKLLVVYKYIEGHDLNSKIDFMKLGQVIGELHKLMKDYKGHLKVQGKDYFINRYIRLLERKKYNTKNLNRFKAYGDYLWEQVSDLERGFCHGDLHKGNVIVDTCHKYHLIDFDTASYAFSLYDIMVICNSTDYFTYSHEAFNTTNINYKQFMKGYANYHILSKREIESFYYFVGIYHYQLQATILEVHGLECVDHDFIDRQLEWLMQWKEQSEDYLTTSFYEEV